MYQNSVTAGIKDSVLVPARMELILAKIEVIIVNKTDLFRDISTPNLHRKMDVGCHLLRDRTS